MERVREGERSWSPARAACSLTYLEAAPLLLGAEREPVWGCPPAPAGCEGQGVEAHWDRPRSGPAPSDWLDIDLGVFERLCFFPWTWAAKAAEAEERAGATAGWTSLWKHEP